MEQYWWTDYCMDLHMSTHPTRYYTSLSIFYHPGNGPGNGNCPWPPPKFPPSGQQHVKLGGTPGGHGPRLKPGGHIFPPAPGNWNSLILVSSVTAFPGTGLETASWRTPQMNKVVAMMNFMMRCWQSCVLLYSMRHVHSDKWIYIRIMMTFVFWSNKFLTLCHKNYVWSNLFEIIIDSF